MRTPMWRIAAPAAAGLALALAFATAAPAAAAAPAEKKAAAAPAKKSADKAAASAAPAKAAPWASAEVRTAASALDTAVRDWLAKGAARPDGFVYGMDVAPILLYAAERKDEALYTQLLPAATRLVVADGDAATDGFVLWRQKDGATPEVSGAEEALWMARGLVAGSRAFKRADDRALASKVLAGYGRHAADQQGTWLVRKYYAFGTKSFATLSVLPGYQADFVSESEAGTPALKGVGARSYNAVQRAVAPSRLLMPLIQPRVGQEFAGLGAARYAPNNVVMLADSCTAAEGARHGLPDVARSVLAFTGEASRHDQYGRLFAYYDRKTGKPVGTEVLGSTGYACLVSLAVELNDRATAASLSPVLAVDLAALAEHPVDAPLYAAGPLLRAANALHAFE